MILKNGTSPIIRTNNTISYSLLYLNSTVVNMRLKYGHSVISVIVDSLPGNTKNRESTRSWLIGVRLFYPWAVCLPSPVRDMSHSYMCNTLHEWGKSHMPHIYMYEWVMSHIRMSFTHVITSHMIKYSRTYSPLQIGWHSISRLFLKLFQRTRILPMGFTISTK